MRLFFQSIGIFLGVVLLCVPVHSQTTVDSLMIALKNASNDTSRVRILSLLAFETGYSNSAEGLEKAEEALKLAEQIGYEEGILSVKNILGRLLFDKGDLDSAMYYYAQVLPEYEKTADPDKIFSLYRNIAMVHQERLNLDNALVYYTKVLDIAKQLDRPKELGNAYNDLGSFYVNRSFVEPDSLKKIAFLKKSEPYYGKAIAYFDKAGYEKGEALCFGNLANIKSGLAEYDSAIVYSLKALDFFRDKNLRTYLSISYNQLSDIYKKMRKFELAREYALKSLETSKEMGNNFDIRNAYANLSQIAEAEGNYREAFEYQLLYNQYENEIINEESQNKINQLEQTYKVESKEKEIKALNSEKLFQQAEIKRQDLLLVFSVGFILLILIVTVLLFYSRKKEVRINKILSEQKREIEEQHSLLSEKNKMIEQQNEQIKVKNERLEHLYDEHRNLVLMLVHDLQSPFNKIKGLSNVLSLMGGLRTEQEEIIGKINQVSENGRQLIADLTSISYFEDESLKAKYKSFRLNYLLKKIQQEHESYANRKNIQLVLKEVDDEVTVSTDRDFFTRIMDNLVSNAIKYSPKNRNVYINPGLSNGSYYVEVKDEGPGIDDEDQKKLFRKFQRLSAQPTDGENSTGLGLNIVKTLVEKLEGSISVRSRLGEGSSFIISFPHH